VPPLIALLNAFGFEKVEATGAPAAVLAAFASSETFRWLRRWAVVAVVALVTPITVITAYANSMPEFHHLAVPIAIAIIVPAWILEFSNVGFPRLALIVATVVPNVWLTMIGHVSTNYLWLLLLVGWVGFAGTRAEGLLALGLSLATIALAQFAIVAPAIGVIDWGGWTVASFALVLTWFMGLVLRRQVVVLAELQLLRDEAEAHAREVAVLQERQRLARELHDSVTQALYGIALYAEAGGRALADGEFGPVATDLWEIGETTQEALGEMRLLLFELRAPVLQEQGLAAALHTRLQAVEARSGLVTEFDCQGDERLPPEPEQELYRVAQEALNNVLKHARAGRVSLRLAISHDWAVLDVADDGVGFEPSAQGTAGFGLRGMRERVERLGGTFRVDSSPGAGTRVHVEIPDEPTRQRPVVERRHPADPSAAGG
jgi:signal transduction histidine kinase